jgi:hypothetical protein
VAAPFLWNISHICASQEAQFEQFIGYTVIPAMLAIA